MMSPAEIRRARQLATCTVSINAGTVEELRKLLRKTLREISINRPQPTLFEELPDPATVEPRVGQNPLHENLRRKALDWIADNPKIYALFERLALDLHAQGKRFGINYLHDRVRWEFRTDPNNPDGEPFKLNNNYRPYIARQLVADHPELAESMRFRETRY